jgi:predicted porin
MKMKPPRHVVCLLGITLITAAQAQSGVTVSGIADAAARTVRNEGRGSVQSLISGGNSTSRLIIRGVEDMGDGLWAGFHLEHGIALDSGTPASSTLFWDRRSTVSLGHRRLGELRAGRDNTPSYNGWGRFDPFAYVGVAGSTNLVSSGPQGPIRSAFGTGPNTLVRASNSLQWLLPAGWGGVEGGVMVAAREGGTSAATQHKVVGARLGFASKGLDLSAALTHTESDLTTAGRFKDAVVGAGYDFGVARVSAALRRFTYADARQTNLLVGLRVPVGRGEVKASWQRANLAGRVGTVAIDANDPTQWGLGYVHHLSKRSALYGTYSQIRNKGATTLAVPGGATGLQAGRGSRGLEFGVRHSF